ncbi:centromere DNA-binding like protein [Nitzschia inconspicua]|uniref:Centromere DNA-binding like protein n=1 Tax=Nitzschia inconspicua TaxID=303405 RepID=A0A9K3K5B3_9STRA|nr:centromere DNA-binding like protein [Nitzschia inconspicua]
MRANTARSYEPRVEEFKAYCDVVFSGLGPERRYTVTHEKIYPFMFYQCFREKKAPASRGAKIPRFNHDDYIAIHNKYSSLTQDQRVEDPKDHVWLAKCEKLMKVVKGRKQRVRGQNYDEKVDHEMSPYGALITLTNRKCSLSNGVVSYVANRSTWQNCRTASCHGSENPGSSPVTVMILQMATGKTNQDLKLYGRVARHKNVNLCSIGALGFYLMYRSTILKSWKTMTTLDGHLATGIPKQNEKAYSNKLPMKIIRQKAGFREAEGLHYNPRVAVIPPTSLTEKVFPCLSDTFQAFTGLSEISPEDDKVTATRFLHFMKVLSEVVIQDALSSLLNTPIASPSSLFQRGSVPVQ